MTRPSDCASLLECLAVVVLGALARIGWELGGVVARVAGAFVK